MSSNRNIDLDRAATAALLDAAPETQEAKSAERPNWLGHGQIAKQQRGSNVDAALLSGATDAQLKALRSTWREHVYHLRKEHGLVVVNHGGLYRFAPIDPPEAAEEAPELQSEAEYPEIGDNQLPPTPRRPQDKVVEVESSQRFHGFVVLPGQTGSPAVAVVRSDVHGAKELLKETRERAIFVITGSDEAAVAAAATAVKQVWNQWINGQPAEAPLNDQVAPSSFMRDRGDWAPRQPTHGAFYVYEYRTHAADTFYVGKGKNGRYLQHFNDVQRKIADSGFSPKERAIANEIAARGSETLVRIVAEFRGPHAELSALVVERFLICTVYGPFSLKNSNLGLARIGNGQSCLHWLCQPKPVRQPPEDVPLWVSAATQLINDGRVLQTARVNLLWMLVRRYEQAIRDLLEEFETTRLEFIGAGNNGRDVSFDWNVSGTPVRIELVFSQHSTTVHFNLRPWAPGWRQSPTAAAHEEFMAFINARFGSAPEGQTLVRKANYRDSFFKPFAVSGADASFDYADPTSMLLVQSLRAGSTSLELNFWGAMAHLLEALESAPDAA